MFDKKKHVPQKRIDCLIGAGTIVHGDISFTGGLRVDGKVEGNVTAAADGSATLVVSEQARVDGDINVSHVVINGAVNGQIKAKDYLELQAKARVAGDVGSAQSRRTGVGGDSRTEARERGVTRGLKGRIFDERTIGV